MLPSKPIFLLHIYQPFFFSWRLLLLLIFWSSSYTFYRLNGKILNFNFPGNTFIHYVERELNVNYRFDKSFSGFVKINNTKQPKSSTIYVRYLSDDSLEHTPVHYEAEARRLNFLQTMSLGRGEISIITSHNVFNLIKNTITSRPYFLTKFEGKGVKAPVLH